MDLEASFVKLVGNFSLRKVKTKWEVIAELAELYVKTGEDIRYITVTNKMKQGIMTPTDLTPYEKYRAEILELIKILAGSQPP